MTQPETELAVESVKVEALEELLNASMDLPSDALTHELLQAAAQQIGDQAPEQEPAAGIADPIPLEAAAFILGISAVEAKDKIKQGSLRGFKVKTKKGKQWFVDPSELSSCQPQTGIEAAPTILPAQEIQSEAELQPDPLEQLCDKQLEIIRELQKTVEALTYRNGYIEAQLSEKESQIKLLTDNQAKQTERHGFWAWLLGTKK